MFPSSAGALQQLAGIGGDGFSSALSGLGLSGLIGKTRFDVLDELVTFIAGDGDDLDSQAARDATCEVLDQIFADADTFGELENAIETSVSREGLASLLEMFLAQYVYNRVPVVAERLSRIADPHAARRADQEMRDLIKDLVSLRLPDDPYAVDWAGPEGSGIARDAVEAVYETLQGLTDEDQ